MGCDLVGSHGFHEAHLFQSTHPHGVRRCLPKACNRFLCFNPRTHMGCDKTPSSRLYYPSRFNPRTHMGCDLNLPIVTKRDYWFQSTHPHGVRHFRGYAQGKAQRFQSTHPHGVRPCFAAEVTYSPVFQSTHPHGVRLAVLAIASCTRTFQSTHPHGVRHPLQRQDRTLGRFQSTHPHGVRLLTIL